MDVWQRLGANLQTATGILGDWWRAGNRNRWLRGAVIVLVGWPLVLTAVALFFPSVEAKSAVALIPAVVGIALAARWPVAAAAIAATRRFAAVRPGPRSHPRWV